MPVFLRQSTAVDLAIGPFVDATDGVTAESGLTITQPDIRLKKNNANWAQKNAAQTLTHEENGWYEVSLDATDTNTVGRLVVSVQESGALPVWHEFYVLEETIYDALFAASATGALPVSTGGLTAASVATGAIDADALAADAGTELAAAVWSTATAGLTVAGTIGKALVDVAGAIGAIKAKTDQLTFTTANKVDATIQAAGDFAQAAADKVWSTGTRALTDKAGFSLSAAGIQGIWDILTTALTTPVSVGKAVVDIGIGVAGNIVTAAAIKTKTDLIPASPAAVGSAMTLDLTQALDLTPTDETVGDALLAARAQGFGSWEQSGTTVTLIAADGTTVVHTLTLNDATNPTSRTEA